MSTFRKTITIILIFIVFFGGLLVNAVSYSRIYNYFSAWTFGLVLGTIGYAIGVLITKKLKHIWAVTPKLKYKKTGFEFIIAIGFIGIFILSGHHINQALSKPINCGKYLVVGKYYNKGGRLSIDRIELYIDFNGTIETIHCNLDRYEKAKIGELLGLCQISSQLGFDYYLLTDE